MLDRQRLGLLEDALEPSRSIRRVEEQEGQHEHALVALFQRVHLAFHVRAIGHQAARQDIHVIAGSDSLLLFLNLCTIQIGNHAPQPLERFHLVDGTDMHGRHHVRLNRKKIREHIVFQTRCKNLHHGNRAMLLAHAEGMRLAEIKAAGCDKILGIQAGGQQPAPIKIETLMRIHMEHAVHDPKPFLAIERFSCHTHAPHLTEQAELDLFKARSGGLDAACVDAERDVLRLRQRIVALGKLALKHPGILLADFIKVVALRRNRHAFLKFFLIGREVEERELIADSRIKGVENAAPTVKDHVLILVMGELVVDILKLDRLGEERIRHLTNAIRPHFLEVDGLLRGIRFLPLIMPPVHDRLDLFSLSPCELYGGSLLSGQSGSPLFLRPPDAQ